MCCKNVNNRTLQFVTDCVFSKHVHVGDLKVSCEVAAQLLLAEKDPEAGNTAVQNSFF